MLKIFLREYTEDYSNNKWCRIRVKFYCSLLPLLLGLTLKFAFFKEFNTDLFIIWNIALIFLWAPLQVLLNFLKESKIITDIKIKNVKLEAQVNELIIASGKHKRIVKKMEKQIRKRIEDVGNSLCDNLINDKPRIENLFYLEKIFKEFISYIWTYYEEGEFGDKTKYRVTLMEPINENELSIIAWANEGECKPESKSIEEQENKRFKIRQGCCGISWDLKELVVIEDVGDEVTSTKNSRFHYFSNSHRKFSIKSMYSFPIYDRVIDGNIFAILNVDCNTKRRFQESKEKIDQINKEMTLFSDYLVLMYKYKQFLWLKLSDEKYENVLNKTG